MEGRAHGAGVAPSQTELMPFWEYSSLGTQWKPEISLVTKGSCRRSAANTLLLLHTTAGRQRGNMSRIPIFEIFNIPRFSGGVDPLTARACHLLNRHQFHLKKTCIIPIDYPRGEEVHALTTRADHPWAFCAYFTSEKYANSTHDSEGLCRQREVLIQRIQSIMCMLCADRRTSRSPGRFKIGLMFFYMFAVTSQVRVEECWNIHPPVSPTHPVCAGCPACLNFYRVVLCTRQQCSHAGVARAIPPSHDVPEKPVQSAPSSFE